MPIHHLLPIELIKTGFTTCPDLKHEKLTLAKLDDKELNVHRVSGGTTRNIVEPPKLPARAACCGAESDAPDKAWEALYPGGSINPAGAIPGGFGFYFTGPKAFSKALEGTEVVLSYRMMLQEGWEFVAPYSPMLASSYLPLRDISLSLQSTKLSRLSAQSSCSGKFGVMAIDCGTKSSAGELRQA